MKRISILVCMVVAALVTADAAFAQTILPGGSLFNPPPPAPPPSPKMDVPVMPKLDAPLRYDYRPAPRPSFSDRITTCLNDSTAAGLSPGDRATYSGACANR
jgi:hypothetical protein